jgi:hypothetical protein
LELLEIGKSTEVNSLRDGCLLSFLHSFTQFHRWINQKPPKDQSLLAAAKSMNEQAGQASGL